jgi:cysteine desulfurase
MANPDLEEAIYLDYQASTPVDPAALEAMRPYWEVEFGNPHSTRHAFGWRADEAVREARRSVADFIGADVDEIVFTSGATEANNLAILGWLAHSKGEGKRVIISEIEHKCVLEAARQLGRWEYEIVLAPVGSDGVVDLDVLAGLIDERTALVSIMTANNEIGSIQPIEAISKLCREFHVAFHTDAAQAGAAMKLDVERLGVDIMSLSAHKLYGPKGIGALYVSHAIRHGLRPIIHGGGQEGGLRSGTLPTPLCVGFGAAAEVMKRRLSHDLIAHKINRTTFLRTLRSYFMDFRVNGSEHGHLGNLNLHLPGVDAEMLTMNLQPRLAVSAGAACSSGFPEPSHVLRAIGLTAEQAGECVRVSFGRFTKEEQAREAAKLLAEMALSLSYVT